MKSNGSSTYGPAAQSGPPSGGEVIGLSSRGLFLTLALLALGGCASFQTYRVAETEEKLVANCTYIDTVTAFSDMGPFQVHPILVDDARDKVLRRAEMLNATHVVWVGDYYFGGAALAYYCWE
jgi:hypothetical protein